MVACNVKLVTVNDISALDKTGRNLIIVAMVANLIHFRIFDAAGTMTDADETKFPNKKAVIDVLRDRFVKWAEPHVLTTAERREIVLNVQRLFDFKLNLGLDPAEFAKQLINQPNGKNVKVALDFYKPTAPNLEQLLKNIDNNQQLIRIQGQTK